MTEGPDGTPSAGATRRAVWWLVGGLGLLALMIILLAPELLGDLTGLGGLFLVVIAGGLPGLLIVLVVASRRRGAPDDETPSSDQGS